MRGERWQDFRPPVSCTKSGRPDIDVCVSRYEPLFCVVGPFGSSRARSSATETSERTLKETENSTLSPAPTIRLLCRRTLKSCMGIGVVGRPYGDGYARRGFWLLLQGVPQKLKEPDHVLMPHEHRYAA
jgi:hypothetical protein